MQQNEFTISVVIPTLNRANYINNLISSIVDQSVQPDQLVVVDQNKDDTTKNIVTSIINPHQNILLTYIHDSSFNSLVQAKLIGSNKANCEIVCFLDDDVILDKDYFFNVRKGFMDMGDKILGCMGFITNDTKKSKIYLAFHRLFFRGMFTDDRPSILSGIEKDSDMLIRCNVLSGGASSWRNTVFRDIEFDTHNNLHYFEDIDFSERAVQLYGNKFYINSYAKMEHITNQAERLNHYIIQKTKIFDAIIYYKKRSDYPGALKDIFLIAAWMFSESMLRVIRYNKLTPMSGFFSGLRMGMKTKTK